MKENIDTKKWFDVYDSKQRDDKGQIIPDSKANIDCRFADHPILDVVASRARRHNVYFYGPVLHMRVKETALGVKAVKNSTSFVLRFDKGPEDIKIEQGIGPQGNSIPVRVGTTGMGKEAFDRACKLIVRCWDAWLHYQKFRKSEVTELEKEALEIIDQSPGRVKGRLMVDRKGDIIEVDHVHDDDVDDNLDFQPEADAEIISRPSAPTKPKGRKKAA